MGGFKKVDPKQNFPEMEEGILKFWEENKIFEKSVEKNSADKSFIFYEGPPTANGKPGLHHVLARAFKDIIPRYKTMKGFRVERKAGWDTHGLPVEIQVEKELGLHNKQDIENIVPGNPRESIIEFNKKCKESVWLYKDLWEKMTKRMAYWVDMENPYITYENKYIESVWWVIAQIFKTKNKKGESLAYKGHKVVPYCYRCGTSLATHEVAQGYKKVIDNAVYVNFKAKPNPEKGIDDNTYFLVWTTTPWTLPGNVALAINPNIQYSIVAAPNGSYIVATDLLKKLLEKLFFTAEASIIKKEISGKDLLGLEYDYLYDTNDTDKKAYYITKGDFVTTQDGTGIVHIAPAFGEDDANIGRENDLPTLLTVDSEGKINVDVPGKGIPVKKKNDKNRYAVDDLIIKDLRERRLFYVEEPYDHDYPFCWRCDMPLIYYAKPSWFIRMSELSDDLVKNNEKINWVPEHIKDGRFGEWLKGAKDWAISRERYWGTPLPVWECEKCGETKVFGSTEELDREKITKNRFYIMRHGETERNLKLIISSAEDKWPLTDKGRKEVEKSLQEIKKHDIDVIYASNVLRAQQTAEIISKKLGVKVITDVNLTEGRYGEMEERSINEPEVGKAYEKWKLSPGYNFPGGENLSQVSNRIGYFWEKVNKDNDGKNILVISHGDPLRLLRGKLSGISATESVQGKLVNTGEFEFLFQKTLDLHKPFIDEVRLKCSCGEEMKRVPEVMDVWFDSGSMPLAQFHYPAGATDEDKGKIKEGNYFPADYISEAIDQTRGWFYTLHAIATLLNKSGKVPTGYAYKNVICLGHILDAKGKKMSKSLGNVIEPMEVMDEYGADMLRWMLFTINQPGLPKKFDPKGMKDIMNRVFRMLWNSYYFFVMYASIDKFKADYKKIKPVNLLDKWIISELNVLIKDVDGKLDNYNIYGAAGSIEKFIDNLSNWYIRRSRKRFWKSENDDDKGQAYQTLHYVLVELSKLMAPFTPFVAEEIYRNLMNPHPNPLPEGEGDYSSVHLADFPEVDEKFIDEKLNNQMSAVRDIITESLQLRAKAGIKVRQPLSELRIMNHKLRKEFVGIIKEEVNIKDVSCVDGLPDTLKSKNWRRNVATVTEDGKKDKAASNVVDIALNVDITEDLELEGQAREIIRHIQQMRKEADYEVDNRIKVCYSGLSEVFGKFGDIIAKEVLADELKSGKMDDVDLEKEFDIKDKKVKINIKKS